MDWFHYQLVPTFLLLVLNVGLVGTALLCALDNESKTARMLALSPQRSWVLISGRILGGFLRVLQSFSCSIDWSSSRFYQPANCTVTGVVWDIFRNCIVRIRHRRNNRNLRERLKICCVSLFDDCHLPVPPWRGLHRDRVCSSLASGCKRVHPNSVLDRRFAASLVLP